MLTKVELKISNLLFRIFNQTKHVERLLQKIMRIGVFMLEARGAYLFIPEKTTAQLVLHSQYTVGNDPVLPDSGEELLAICKDCEDLWVEDNGRILIPLGTQDTVHAMLCFSGVSRQLNTEMIAALNRVVKQFLDLYNRAKILQDKEDFHNALIEISQVITQSYDFENVISDAMRMASEASGAMCGLMLLSSDEQFLVPVYTHNVSREDSDKISFPPEPGHDKTAYLALSKRKVFFVEDAWSDPLADQTFCKKNAIRSYMTLPLIIHDRPIGVLYVNYSYPKRFYDQEVTFFTELGHQISHVINTLQTRREILETKLLQDRLIEMMREMSSRTRLRDVLSDMVVKTQNLLEEKVGVSVWLANESKTRIKLSAWKGAGMRLNRHRRVEFSLGELGSSATLQDRYLELDQASAMGSFFRKSGADITIGTPLVAGKDVIGILFFHSQEGHKWTEQEKLTLAAIGIHAGPIIRNGQYIQLLEKKSKLDGLTRVYNRQYFEQTFRAYSQRHVLLNKPFSVLMIDLDNFKQINDRYGHTAGDKVMRAVAQILQDTIRKADKVFRYGGEEFCVLLPWTARKQAEQVAERIRLTVETAELDPPVTVSIGVATYPENSTDSNEILELADWALYEAKSRGKNRVVSAL